jgi:hypothetical protein
MKSGAIKYICAHQSSAESLISADMFSRSKSQRHCEIDFFLQYEEMKRQDYRMKAESRQSSPMITPLERILNLNMDTSCVKSRQGDSAQQEIMEKRTLEAKNRNDVKEFLEKRTEQRRLYQVNKNKALLAEFLEQRAHARREYREAKARGDTTLTAQNSRQQNELDSPGPTRRQAADEVHQHTRQQGIEIKSGTTTRPAQPRTSVKKRVKRCNNNTEIGSP